MRMVFGLLATLVSIYSILILIRIIISWFSNTSYGRPVGFLSSITDPYLDWWRRNLNMRIGFLDFSAIAGIAALSVIQNILYSLSIFEVITLGNVLAIVLFAVWSVVSFILVFCFIVIVIRLFGYLTNQNIYSPFWRIVDSISQPLLYRINRIFFGKRIAGYMSGIILALVVLAAIWIAGRYAVPVLAGLLSSMPI